MIFVGFTKDIVLAAPRRPDKPSPWVNSTTIRQDQMFWMTEQAYDEIHAAHPGAICDMTPHVVSMVWGWTTPKPLTLLRVVDCPTCNAGKADRLTLCPLCRGNTKVYNL